MTKQMQISQFKEHGPKLQRYKVRKEDKLLDTHHKTFVKTEVNLADRSGCAAAVSSASEPSPLPAEQPRQPARTSAECRLSECRAGSIREAMRVGGLAGSDFCALLCPPERALAVRICCSSSTQLYFPSFKHPQQCLRSPCSQTLI